MNRTGFYQLFMPLYEIFLVFYHDENKFCAEMILFFLTASLYDPPVNHSHAKL